MDKNVDISLLLDIYGNALPKVQRDSLDLYYNSDLSLGEIADNTGKTRQSVHDTLKRGEQALSDMENSLHILAKNQVFHDKIANIKLLVKEIKKCSDVYEMHKLIFEIILKKVFYFHVFSGILSMMCLLKNTIIFMI